MYTHVRTDRTYPPHLYRSAVVLRGDDTRPNSYRGYRLLSNNAKTKDAEEVAIHRIRVHSRGTFRLAICAYVMEHGDDIKTMRLHCYLDALCRTTATGVIAKTVYVTYIYILDGTHAEMVSPERGERRDWSRLFSMRHNMTRKILPFAERHVVQKS